MRSFRLSDERVQLLGRGDIAVVTYSVEVSGEMAGTARLLAGTELTVLAKRGGRWLLVADQHLPGP